MRRLCTMCEGEPAVDGSDVCAKCLDAMEYEAQGQFGFLIWVTIAVAVFVAWILSLVR